MVPKVVSLFARTALGAALLVPASAHAASPPETSSPAHHPAAHHRAGKKTTPAISKRAPHKDAPKPEKADATDPPPKQSLTPLPTIAAAMGTPLATPIGTDVEHAKKDHDADAKGHAREPRRTPLLISTLPHAAKKPPCLRDAVDIVRGTEEAKLSLTKCDGSIAPLAVESLSILTRPGSAAKPAEPIKELAKKSGTEIAPGIRRLDGRLVERLQTIVDHFGKSRVFVVSGYRPAAAGSFHANGRALDFKIDGVKNEDLVAFCKTLPDTGCGFYPNSSFIHVDVRSDGAGHVSWIDASGPGESPKYVASWPPKADDESTDPAHLLAKLDTELQILPPPLGESKPDTGSKSELAGRARDHEDAPPAMIEREIDVR
jgi:hypothetical protein